MQRRERGGWREFQRIGHAHMADPGPEPHAEQPKPVQPRRHHRVQLGPACAVKGKHQGDNNHDPRQRRMQLHGHRVHVGRHGPRHQHVKGKEERRPQGPQRHIAKGRERWLDHQQRPAKAHRTGGNPARPHLIAKDQTAKDQQDDQRHGQAQLQMPVIAAARCQASLGKNQIQRSHAGEMHADDASAEDHCGGVFEQLMKPSTAFT